MIHLGIEMAPASDDRDGPWTVRYIDNDPESETYDHDGVWTYPNPAAALEGAADAVEQAVKAAYPDLPGLLP